MRLSRASSGTPSSKTPSDQNPGRSLREFIISDRLESAGGAEEDHEAKEEKDTEEKKLAEPPQPDAIISDREPVAAVAISIDRQKQTKKTILVS